MNNNPLQKVAEQVLDVEARIINWQGSITDWSRDLIRLRATIQKLLDSVGTTKDANQAEFLRQLLHKTNLCRENVLSRARWMASRHQSDGLKDESYIHSGGTAG